MAGMRGVVRKILFPAGKGGKWMEKDITTKNLLENNDVFADIANVNLFGGDLLMPVIRTWRGGATNCPAIY